MWGGGGGDWGGEAGGQREERCTGSKFFRESKAQ